MHTVIQKVLILFLISFETGLGQRYRQPLNNQQSIYNNYIDDQNNNLVVRASGSCPEPNGTYPTGACDGYIECKNGIPEDKLCADGLLFNAAAGPQAFPCQYPIDVDCQGRASTQPPQPTEDCPHQFGYYRLGDAANCGQFMNCVDGRGFTFDCPEGLAFNGASYRCDWPDQVADCDAEAFLGFTCPERGAAKNAFFISSEYRFYRSPHDCQRYFICIDGRPRLGNCGDNQAFNELTNTCDGVENVTGCAQSYNADNSKFDTRFRA